MNISGSIGLTVLEKNNKKIMLFYDIHSKVPYCKNINGTTISKYIKNHLYKGYDILLEEVPRGITELEELWPESPHTQELKQTYLDNSKIIDAIDIRIFLFPFSWEIINVEKELGNIILINYIEQINNFFEMKSDFYNDLVVPLVKNKKVKNSGIGQHFLSLKELFKNFKISNKEYLNIKLIDIYNNNRNILLRLNDLASNIMEWYVILKLFSSDKPSIIHTGLHHSDNILNKLKNYYGFTIKYQTGVNHRNEREFNVNSCVYLPDDVSKYFSSYNEKYKFGFF